MNYNGVGVALITPFKTDKSIDFDALGRVIDGCISGGVDYLVALGTTGETPTLSTEERMAVLQFVAKYNAGRVPVVCGMGSNNTAEVLEGLKTYPLEGVSAILTVVPYYSKPQQEGMFQHFSAIAGATDLEIILYNVPGRTVANMLPATVKRLAEKHANIKAIKEASGNMAQCMELVHLLPADFAVLSGDDNLVVAQAAIGMKGVISVAANCYPEDFCSMVHSALGNDFAAARKILKPLLPKIDLLFAEGNPTGAKCVLAADGVIENELRLPLIAASEGLAKALIG